MSAALAAWPLVFALTAPPPDTVGCAAAAQLLRTGQHMVAVVEADTVDDWRTDRRTPGCRITAAGATALAQKAANERFYDRVRAAGWTRTPDPRDAPNESSLRFRLGDTDCLFSLAGEAMLFTEAESRVIEAVTPGRGERRYFALVQCVPAAAARPRS